MCAQSLGSSSAPTPQHDKSFSWLLLQGGWGAGYAEREKELAPPFKSPHLGKRSGDEVGVGPRLGTCGVDRTGNAGQLLGGGVLSVSGVASSLEGARKGVLRVPVVAGNGMWGTHANKLICREVCATS